MKRKATVLVAGSWGTALAAVLADNHYEVTIWARNPVQVEEINNKHTNSKFLKGAVLPDSIQATTEIEEALLDASIVLFAAPSSAMREVAKQAAPFISPEALCIHATKGFESGSFKRMTTVLAEELKGDPNRLVVLSGPSHAEEVVRRQPTTVVVASLSQEAAERAQDAFITPYFRVYTNMDVVGVEVAGAIKNIIALGAGLTDGLGFGDNAKAALLTRGLAEISRLGIAMGANPLTFAGLAGVGDLVVTCTSKHSRNWRAGSMLAEGLPLADVLTQMGMVVEGVRTTSAAHELSIQYEVEMPITEQLYQVLFENKPPRQAVESLMGRGRTHEMEEDAGSWGLHQS
ncbi:glycerol-3-phosphate dehydrogenase [NAD(P)+] [Paenibacillus baekrokdamisoli]|uniref:Glycerol-3-phosphate dehydrogenase [NAD(P)+] n=1 Tax=Paenibacillus baekrokdamisoli TaxID=1712516 RepID=A0A3G9J5K3_9BACL|nr:NAD(P)H-dependent glycerol-3-phosphate dehydrogenase [Paenibacillus baekrokdamisoli]MBB3069635.1 glycerol-3-phosphate dehydrogenase (NAD(P)+) [Paenibacillus baekrokdamisoli]BBH21011.1 glycerol-3-phosphate dehydrogenase [NAD(P)+] [Paenibacillus baekrokdamisoli]